MRLRLTDEDDKDLAIIYSEFVPNNKDIVNFNTNDNIYITKRVKDRIVFLGIDPQVTLIMEDKD